MIPALILAGGLGTRLRPVVGETAKPMAPVAGRPFLAWLLDSLELQGMRQVMLCLGYRAESIRAEFGQRHGKLELRYSIEKEPLGTGGAIAQARRAMGDEEMLALNGDTFAALDLARLVAEGRRHHGDITVALHAVPDTGRFGAVETAPDHRITAFLEKGRSGPGLINAGVYHLPAGLDLQAGKTANFSFEREVLATASLKGKCRGVPLVSDFIDIGVPEDYARAQTKVPQLAALRP